MISAFVPRPIALVSSLSAAGVGNVAPFSYSGVVNHDPPAIAVSVCRVGAGGQREGHGGEHPRDGRVRRQRDERVVRRGGQPHLRRVRARRRRDGRGEPLAGGLAPRRAAGRQSAVQFECKTLHTHEMRNRHGLVTATLVGEVVMCHVRLAARPSATAPASRASNSTTRARVRGSAGTSARRHDAHLRPPARSARPGCDRSGHHGGRSLRTAGDPGPLRACKHHGVTLAIWSSPSSSSPPPRRRISGRRTRSPCACAVYMDRPRSRRSSSRVGRRLVAAHAPEAREAEVSRPRDASTRPRGVSIDKDHT